MSRRPRKFSPLHRLALCLSLCLSFLTGVTWWSRHDPVSTPGGIETGSPSTDAWLTGVHETGLFASLIVLAWLLTLHVKAARRSRHKRMTSGLVLIGGILQFLIGYALHHTGDPMHAVAGRIHVLIGLVLPILVGLHIIAGLGRHRRKHLELEPAPYIPGPNFARPSGPMKG